MGLLDTLLSVILTDFEFVVISSGSAVCPIVVVFVLLNVTSVARGERIVALVLRRIVFIGGENAANLLTRLAGILPDVFSFENAN